MILSSKLSPALLRSIWWGGTQRLTATFCYNAVPCWPMVTGPLHAESAPWTYVCMLPLLLYGLPER